MDMIKIISVKTILENRYQEIVSLKKLREYLDGNPMIDEDTKVVDIAQMIASHLADE